MLISGPEADEDHAAESCFIFLYIKRLVYLTCFLSFLMATSRRAEKAKSDGGRGIWRARVLYILDRHIVTSILYIYISYNNPRGQLYAVKFDCDANLRDRVSAAPARILSCVKLATLPKCNTPTRNAQSIKKEKEKEEEEEEVYNHNILNTI